MKNFEIKEKKKKNLTALMYASKFVEICVILCMRIITIMATTTKTTASSNVNSNTFYSHKQNL